MTVAAPFWRDKRVLVTGHTGFKGSWLSQWLLKLGARVSGLSLPPDTEPSLFVISGLGARMESMMIDVREREAVRDAVRSARPEIVFHLAAQSLVRRSFQQPVDTFDTNVMGTVHLLDAISACETVQSAVIVTSDKCYANLEQGQACREDDAMGGDDPYSASKGCAELVVAAWRHSFFDGGSGRRRVALASARAGNVLGGGDWATDRLVPDCIRAFLAGQVVRLRNPSAVRPWQHVLEPLGGYLALAEHLYEGGEVAEGWNFGPASQDARPVSWVTDHVARLWSDTAKWQVDETEHPPEALSLYLDASKARARLGWRPQLDLSRALEWTVEWYRRVHQGEHAGHVSDEQIERYLRLSEESS